MLKTNFLFLFQYLQEQSPSYPCTVAQKEACRDKTRYVDIIPCMYIYLYERCLNIILKGYNSVKCIQYEKEESMAILTGFIVSLF